jgi:hypothetical protein
MKTLQELISIVNKYKTRNVQIIGNHHANKKKHGKIFKLYDAISSGQVSTDTEAAQHLDVNLQSSTYRNLKNDLKSRLINTVFFIDVKQPNYNNYQRAYYNAWKDLAAAKILFGKRARTSGLEVTHKVLKIAEKYEHLDLLVDALKVLRLHHGSITGDTKNFNLYNEKLKHYQEAFQAETEAEEYYCILASEYVNSKASREEVYEKAKEFGEALAPFAKKFPYARLQMLYRIIRIAGFMSINQFEEARKISQEGIEFFSNKKFEYQIAIQILLHQQLICNIQLKQYDEGKRCAEQSLSYIPQGTHNWYNHYELELKLAMHTENYQEAYSILKIIESQSNFSQLPAYQQEKWLIYRSFIHYLVILEKIRPDKEDGSFNNFRIGRFLNEVPKYSKDKEGLNIPILVIQILFLILKKRYDETIDRIENIEKYCYRYLRKDHTYRSNCFIKMLLQIPISGFHRAGVQRRAATYLKKLNNTSLEASNQAHDIEIIPYETLWEFALDSLENKFYKQKPANTGARARMRIR